jgi:hypothetical protein
VTVSPSRYEYQQKGAKLLGLPSFSNEITPSGFADLGVGSTHAADADLCQELEGFCWLYSFVGSNAAKTDDTKKTAKNTAKNFMARR